MDIFVCVRTRFQRYGISLSIIRALGAQPPTTGVALAVKWGRVFGEKIVKSRSCSLDRQPVIHPVNPPIPHPLNLPGRR